MTDELAAHVQFLCQPKLKGRGLYSAGSAKTRRYIEDRFRAFGLLPWGREKSYELSFGLGGNVVGVLPGSETNGPIVLLSAHYDHLGTDKKGKIYPGAADNASGVATLLEVARQLSAAKERPKRTIAFAAFDAEEEMLLGSFAFTCRPDVEAANFAAVVNVDTLGRDFLDVVSNTVFVAGTDRQPELQAQVREFGTEVGIRVLPVASHLIGPRSDHAAFENRVAPCLFFSCGTYADYHQPSDTPEKLNYTNLVRSTQVVLKTVERLANEPVSTPAGPRECNREELKSAQIVLSELSRNPEKAGIKVDDTAALTTLNDNIAKALRSDLNDADLCEKIFLDAVDVLVPLTMPGGSGPRKASFIAATFPLFEHMYVNYRREWLEGQKLLVSKILERSPDFYFYAALPPFKYEIRDLRDQDISFQQTSTNGFALHALVNAFSCETHIKKSFWPSKPNGVDLGVAVEMLDCEGSRAELLDYCVLQWRLHPTNTLHARVMREILRTVTGNEPRGSCADYMKEHLRRSGYTNATDWLLNCIQSSNPDLAQMAVWEGRNSSDPRIRAATRQVLHNREMRGDVRWDAMRVIIKRPDKTVRLALEEVASDQTPVFKREYIPQFSPNYPLTNSTSFLAMRDMFEWQFSHFTNTIGNQAAENLKNFKKE